MKHLLLSAFVALTFTTACAQPERGTFSIIPRIGVALSNISHESLGLSSGDASRSDLYKGRYREGAAVGIDAQYQATDNFAASLGLFYTRQGCRYKDTDLTGAEKGEYSAFSDIRFGLDYLNIPILAHLYIADGLSLNAGFQCSFLLRNRLNYDVADVTINKGGSYTYKGQTESNSIKQNFIHNTDLSIPIGFSYEYANVVLDFRYNIALTKLYDKPLGDDNCRNRAFVITAGYKLNL